MNISIKAETPGVATCLCEMVLAVQSGGGQIHPGVCIVEQSGQFTIHCDASRGMLGDPLFYLPDSLLIPVQDAQWADSQQALVLTVAPPHLTAIQRHLLDLHLELYNLTEKLDWAVKHHPRLALQTHSPLLAALVKIRPDFSAHDVGGADIFLQTRVFCLPAPESNGTGTSVLMPLIDLLNHHPAGAPFKVRDHALRLEIRQPTGGTECFAHYGGRRDALDLALQYGYLDSNTPFAYCSPVKVELQGLGQLSVLDQRMKATHPLNPPRITFDDGGVSLSHLTCDRRHPQRFSIALQFAIQAVAHRNGLAASQIDSLQVQARAALYQANTILLENLYSVAIAQAKSLPAAEILARASQHQAGILNNVMGCR